MDGFKKGDKFIPTEKKRIGVSSLVIQKGRKDHEIGVARNNFSNHSDDILAKKLAHLNNRN
jgi:hypothetical protein